MAKKRAAKQSPQDYGSWNFILFLTLGLMLIVGLVYAINRNTSNQPRAGVIVECDNPIYPSDWKAQKETCESTPNARFSWRITESKGGACIVQPECIVEDGTPLR